MTFSALSVASSGYGGGKTSSDDKRNDHRRDDHKHDDKHDKRSSSSCD